MPLYTMKYSQIRCDICGYDESSHYIGAIYSNSKDAIKMWRTRGWVIGKKVKCLKCKPLSRYKLRRKRLRSD